jgi:hypothetical protein
MLSPILQQTATARHSAIPQTSAESQVKLESYLLYWHFAGSQKQFLGNLPI